MNMTCTPTGHGIAVAINAQGRTTLSTIEPVTGIVAGEFDHTGRFFPAQPIRTPLQKTALRCILNEHAARRRATRDIVAKARQMF